MKVFSSEVVRNSAKLISANAIAQVIALLFYPLLTRLYSPDAFGVLNLFLSIGGVIVLLATADYQYAILLPKDEKQAASVFQGSFFLMLGVVALTALSVFFSKSIASVFKAPELAVFYPLLPLFVLLSALWVLLNYWFTRQKNFNAVSIYQINQSLGNSVFKYGLGLAGFLHGGLFWGTLLGLFNALGISIGTTFKKWRKTLFSIEPAQVRSALREYRKFPFFSLPKSLVNNLSANLPFFLLTPAFGLGPVGFFGMALTLSFRPVNMVIGSLHQVLFQRFSEKVQNRESIRGAYLKFLGCVFAVVIPCFAGLYFVLPQLCGWLLGAEWAETGHHIRLLLPWIAMTCAGGTVCFISDIFRKQAKMLAVEITYLALRAAGLLIGIALHNLPLAIGLYSLSGVLVITVQLFMYGRFIREYERQL